MNSKSNIEWISWPEDNEIIETYKSLPCPDENDLEELKRHITEHGFKFGGLYHQNNRGVPVMKGKKPWFFSYRKWGEIMSLVWGGDYTDYAWEYKIEGGKTPGDNNE